MNARIIAPWRERSQNHAFTQFRGRRSPSHQFNHLSSKVNSVVTASPHGGSTVAPWSGPGRERPRFPVGYAATKPSSLVPLRLWVTPAPAPPFLNLHCHAVCMANCGERKEALLMSSFIPKQPKREREQITIKLEKDLLRKLEQYGRYLESSRDYIISAALELIFRRDKAFATWLQDHGDVQCETPTKAASESLKAARKLTRSISSPTTDTAA